MIDEKFDFTTDVSWGSQVWSNQTVKVSKTGWVVTVTTPYVSTDSSNVSNIVFNTSIPLGCWTHDHHSFALCTIEEYQEPHPPAQICINPQQQFCHNDEQIPFTIGDYVIYYDAQATQHFGVGMVWQEIVQSNNVKLKEFYQKTNGSWSSWST